MIDSFICLDLETTGLNPKTDKIIEIGAVRIENGVETGTFETFVNPGRLLEERIASLTGITDEDLKDAPLIAEVLPQFIEFTKGLPLLGHSVLFDFSFIKKAAVNQKLTFEREGVDTLKIARKYLAELPHRSLGYLCEHYGIEHQAHRALQDVRATIRLHEILWENFGVMETVGNMTTAPGTPVLSETSENKKNSLFTPAKLIYQAKKDSPITKNQKERLYKLINQHKIKTDYDIDKLTKSEASRYTDRILAEYGR